MSLVRAPTRKPAARSNRAAGNSRLTAIANGSIHARRFAVVLATLAIAGIIAPIAGWLGSIGPTLLWLVGAFLGLNWMYFTPARIRAKHLIRPAPTWSGALWGGGIGLGVAGWAWPAIPGDILLWAWMTANLGCYALAKIGCLHYRCCESRIRVVNRFFPKEMERLPEQEIIWTAVTILIGDGILLAFGNLLTAGAFVMAAHLGGRLIAIRSRYPASKPISLLLAANGALLIIVVGAGILSDRFTLPVIGSVRSLLEP